MADATKVLFVCSRNKLRSPTAEAVFSGLPGLEVLSAGTDHDAEMPVDAELIEWAEIILVMESRHKRRLKEMFDNSLRDKKLVVLGIPDKFAYMDPDLVKILEVKVPAHLERLCRRA